MRRIEIEKEIYRKNSKQNGKRARMWDGEELSYKMVIFAGVNFDQNQINVIVRNTESEKAPHMLEKSFPERQMGVWAMQSCPFHTQNG